ncbi:aminoglycoside adenylyltransferase domain-containing protein [Nakamurella endophytica]|uniref:DUF4111 domain-containing protein n=1 Tax=Nakamurella endophytica TaxID=1748367 RepID=A0A917W991_9ACTN|nr:aminoglycoside adenylyltransferase domain-containing protein [Nakamurella endophytica]GGL85296.1 hypothetical protein GCM10011594_01210 [Nakamurella endophytica]
MPVTSHPDVDELVGALHRGLRTVLGDRLLSLSVFGSVAAGAYDPGISDVDLLAVLDDPPTPDELYRLAALHAELVAGRPAWQDRVEVLYVPRETLRTYRSTPGPLAVVSPGEPLHLRSAGREWTLNLSDARENAVLVAGPAPARWIDPVPAVDLVECARGYAAAVAGRAARATTLGGDAYTVLILCRALHLHATGRPAGKAAAARWVARRHPRWSGLADRATAWRLGPDGPAGDGHRQVLAFAVWAADELSRPSPVEDAAGDLGRPPAPRCTSG